MSEIWKLSNERPRPGQKPKLDTKAKARLIAEACSKAPEGQTHWTMQLLADRLVELKIVETISDETVRRALKNDLKPWLKEQWCIPTVSSEFVAAMEETLDLYATPYDPERAKINFDETNKQLIKETRIPLPAQPGQLARYDFEYERIGTRKLFMFVEPQAGWRHVEVIERRTQLLISHSR